MNGTISGVCVCVLYGGGGGWGVIAKLRWLFGLDNKLIVVYVVGAFNVGNK